MIVRPRPTMLQLLYAVKGSVLPVILPEIAVVTGIAVLVVAIHTRYPELTPTLSSSLLSLVGIALSVFLAFRNSACYDRWWEGRMLWGKITYTSRGLSRQTKVLEQDESGRALRRRLILLNAAFAHALVPHLRDVPPAIPSELLTGADLAALRSSRNPPERILQLMADDLAAATREGRISDIMFQTLDRSLQELGLAMAGCERLRMTPVPFGYTLLLHRTAWLFCLFIPFGFADMLGWGTPVAVALISYCFFGLDAMGDQMERPFDTQPNALPIEAIALTIEINLREALGETDLPPLPQPVDRVLM